MAKGKKAGGKKSGGKKSSTKKGGAKKGTEKARRQELGEMSMFRLKREAVKAGLDQDLVREATDEEELIEQIIEAEFGDGPKKSPKKSGKGSKKSKKEEPEEEEEEEEGEEDDEGEEDGDDDGEDDEGEEDGDDEEGDDDGEDDDEGEDEEPARTPVRTEKSLDEEKLDAILDGLAVIRKDVAEVKSDFDGLGKYILLIWSGFKAGMLKIGKAVGTKGMKGRLEKEEAKILGESEDD